MRDFKASVALAKLLPLALYIYREVDKADAEPMTADDAGLFAVDLAQRVGNLRIMVNGRDILGDVAQGSIADGLGRMALRLSRALRSE